MQMPTTNREATAGALSQTELRIRLPWLKIDVGHGGTCKARGIETL